jgi:hypothetical protein
MKANNQITSVVDELGLINEQIKMLEARAKELKEVVANEFGEGATVGQNFVCKISLSQRKTLDAKGIVSELAVPADVVERFTKISSVITVKTERVQIVA